MEHFWRLIPKVKINIFLKNRYKLSINIKFGEKKKKNKGMKNKSKIFSLIFSY